MFITLESDYAVRIVACLAKENRRLDAKTISEMTCVTLRFALKILRKLVSAEIVKSFKGLTLPCSSVVVTFLSEAYPLTLN